MKQLSTLPCIFLFCLCLVAGCSTSTLPPSVRSISGSDSITAGETGFIRWVFSDADSVLLEGLPGVFKSSDIAYVAPAQTTTYRITGYRGEDSVTTIFTMRVVEPSTSPAVTQVETGGAIEGADGPESIIAESSIPSLYYSGTAEEGDRPEQLKIMRALPAGKGLTPSFHAILLDQYGNLLQKRDTLFAPLKFNCVGSFATISRTPEVHEITTEQSSPVSIALCADYSQAMGDMLPDLENAYRSFFSALASHDEVSFVRYDHRTETVFQLVPSDRAAAQLAPGSVYRGGLTAVYKAAWAGLKSLKKSPMVNKALVLVSGGSENSSLQYTAGDIAEAARAMDIPIYTIAVGMNAETYSLRYLSDYSGGRFYQVARPDEVAALLKEIAFSYRAYYSVSYNPHTASGEVEKCPGMVYTTIGLGGGLDMIREMRIWNTDRQTYAPFNQVMATFPDHSFDIPSIYSEQISSLATLLKDNPDKPVELIGHAEPELSEDDALHSSLRRAQAVRDALIKLGVQAPQVRIRGAGGSTPIYYFAAHEWQQDLNRRVEIRWLDPSLLPFEIVAQTVFTELEAERLTTEWARRGQKAYYELVMSKRTPAFRIKLWGYETYDRALDAKTSLQKKYRVALTVQ